jgi:hypothetical protein
MLTISAAVLLVPAIVGLLSVGRHAHMAAVETSTRRARLVRSAALVCLGSLATGAALGAERVVVALVTTFLTLSVLARWRFEPSWAVRGVLVWSLLASGTFGLLAWLAQRIVGSSSSASGLGVGSAAWLVLLLAAWRTRGYVRELVASRAVRDATRTPEATPRPLPWLVVTLLAGGVALGSALTLPVPSQVPAPSRAEHLSSDRSTRPASTSPSGASPSADGRTTQGSSHGGPSRADRAVQQQSTSRPGQGAGRADGGPPASPSPVPTTATKTPGYAKDHPNRPEGAPSPGSGRPDRP